MSENSDNLPVAVRPVPGVPVSIVRVEVDEKGIRTLKFSDERINKAIDKQLGTVGGDVSTAFSAIAFKDSSGKIETKLAVYVTKKHFLTDKGTFSFGGFLEGNVKNPLDTVGAELRATF